MSTLHPPSSTQKIGTFNNVAYVRYKGKFTGKTGCGKFAVPYEITTPANPQEGNRTFVLEPPHFASGFVARDGSLSPRFLFGKGFSHAAVGYSNFRGRILDPAPGFTPMICDAEFPINKLTTDYDILRELALALKQKNPPAFIGEAERIYSIGFSDSGDTVHHIYKLFGHQVFDITFACIARYFDPVKISGQKPIMVFNTEADFDARAVPKPNFPQYRWYGVPGGAHIPDSALSRREFTDPPQQGSPAPPVAGTSPINWLPIIRALFIAGDRWVRNDVKPPASVTLKVNVQGNIARDARCNALGGIRHPALENDEATFISSVIRGNGWDLFGAYGNPRELAPAEFPGYLDSFTKATEALFAAKFLLPTGRARLIREAQLHPSDTYTLNYLRGRLFPVPVPDEDD